MECKHRKRVNDYNFCNAVCRYCTFEQEKECEMKRPEYFEEQKFKHPFVITCKKCGSDNIQVFALEYNDLAIRCSDCGLYLNCGSYHTKEYDYSNAYN